METATPIPGTLIDVTFPSEQARLVAFCRAMSVPVYSGPQGETGADGAVGPTGGRGKKGDKGDNGDKGDKGEPSTVTEEEFSVTVGNNFVEVDVAGAHYYRLTYDDGANGDPATIIGIACTSPSAAGTKVWLTTMVDNGNWKVIVGKL